MLRVALASLLAAPVFGAGYSYDRCDNQTGPQAWGGSCQGQVSSGTPINLCGAVPFANGQTPSPVITGYNVVRNGNIKNTGTTIEVGMIDNKPTVQFGNLSSIVGRASASTSTPTWILQQLHLHWGRTDKTDEGSEHYLNGERYPLEAHFVHYNAAYDNLTNAVSKSDGLLVVGVFMALGSTDVPLMTQIAANVTTLTQTPKPLNNIDLSGLYDGTGSFYSYAGSLTTPGCNEVVTWVVQLASKSITLATLNKIKQASANPPTSSRKFQVEADNTLISLYGNFRPIQTTGTRTIYNSAGTNGPACASYTNPVFTCASPSPSPKPSSAVSMALSPLVLLSSLLFLFVSSH